MKSRRDDPAASLLADGEGAGFGAAARELEARRDEPAVRAEIAEIRRLSAALQPPPDVAAPDPFFVVRFRARRDAMAAQALSAQPWRRAAQYLMPLAAGALITAAFARGGPELVLYLPGAWAIVFGLGTIAARPYLPRGTGFVGLGYVVAGGALLARAPLDLELSGWTVGGVFGPGHLATALVIWRDQPRETDA